MYRDTLILLVLKEIFKDPYLVNYIHDIVEEDEVNHHSAKHKKKTEMLREDIQILYPGFIKSAVFENIRI